MSLGSNLPEINTMISVGDYLLDCESFIDPNLILTNPDLTLDQDFEFDHQTTHHQTVNQVVGTAQDHKQLTPEVGAVAQVGAGDDTAHQLTPEQQSVTHVDDTAQDQNQLAPELTPEQQSVTHVDDTAQDQNQLTTEQQSVTHVDDTAQDQNQLTPEEQSVTHVDDTAQDENQLAPEQQSVTHVDNTAQDQNQLTPEPNQSPQGETVAVQVTANGKGQEGLHLVKRKASASRTHNSGRAIPEGWTIEDKTRANGATAGTVDKYYIDPVTGYKFRSKKEVFEFLDTGSTRRKRKSMENSNADPKTAGSSVKRKSAKKESKPKETVLKFDFSDIPEKVTWKLTDAPTNKWTPFLNDEKEPVPEETQKVWKAAYNYVMSSQGDSSAKLEDGESAKPEDSEKTGLSGDKTVKDD